MRAEPHTPEPAGPRPQVVLRGATVTVPAEAGPGRRTLLGPLDLVLSEPRITVIGANGSGKSTLLRLLNGLVLPTAGSVHVDGLDTARHGSDVRRRVAFAFTDPIAQLIMPTGREDVELSLRRVHRSRVERRRAAEVVLDRFGLAALSDRSVHELSGGERQLMALAVVLATDPRLLVLDEPTTLLDLRNTIALRRTLASLHQTVVTATHDLDLALDADRTLVIDGGSVVFDGTPRDAVEHYRRAVGEP
jgi:biotin transport system ATP-binding protein